MGAVKQLGAQPESGDDDDRRHWPIRLHFVDDPVLALQPA